MPGIDGYRTPTGDRRYRVRWRQRRDEVVVRQFVTFENRQDTERFVRMLDIFHGDGDRAWAAVAAPTPPVQDVREMMLAYVDANHRTSPAQLRKYRNQIRDHFDDELGHTPIDRLDTDTVHDWVARLRTKPIGAANNRPRRTNVHPARAARTPIVDPDRHLSPKTIRKLHGLLSASMAAAAHHGRHRTSVGRDHRPACGGRTAVVRGGRAPGQQGVEGGRRSVATRRTSSARSSPA